MHVIVFRSRLRNDFERAEYDARAQEVLEIGRQMPGFVSLKTFTADDGERLSLVEFESGADVKGWARNTDHIQAKKEGRERFYSEYRIQICEELRRSEFP
jgi:heme-degrading monooxygenase HmoA